MYVVGHPVQHITVFFLFSSEIISARGTELAAASARNRLLGHGGKYVITLSILLGVAPALCASHSLCSGVRDNICRACQPRVINFP